MRIAMLLALLAGTCLTMPSANVRAETFNTCSGFITAVPAVISTQGTWCLGKDLSTSISNGAAIEVQVNNVTLDCNGYKLGGLAAGPSSTATGVHALNRLNTTIRNCTIRGFYQGIHLEGSAGGGHLVENNRVDQSLQTGINVEGDNSTVRDSFVFDTGGATGQTLAHGIITRNSVDVIDNTVSTVLSLQDPYGMAILDNVGGQVSGNRIRGLQTVNGYYHRIGIFGNNNYLAVVKNNTIVMNGNTAYSWGVYCTLGTGTGTNLRDNSILGFGTIQEGCIDAGGNDSA